MSLSEKIQQDLVAAMRSKEALRLATLRMAKSAIKNREVEKGGALTDAETQAVLKTLVKQRRDSAAQFRQGGRAEMAEREEAEIGVIESYLPAPASDDEIDAAIGGAIEETGAAGMGDMGKVMKAVMARLGGKLVDGGIVSGRVRERLSK